MPSDHEIVVIDNGSSDETKSQLEGSKEIVYHRNNTNLGFAKACNLGYTYSNGSYVLFLNNDIRVKDKYNSWTEALIKDDVLCGPTMGQLDKNLNFVKEANEVLDGKSYLSGWCIAASRLVWDKLHIPRGNGIVLEDHKIFQIFSEEFGLAYFEDTDLGFRARKMGIKMEVIDVPVVHFGKQTSRQLNTYQLYTDARKIFVKKWGQS